MGIFFSPEGNPEIWDSKPDGYYTPEEWESYFPPPPGPSPDAASAARKTEIRFLLMQLDGKYLTPRVLARAHAEDTFALSQIEEHELQAAPLRAELAELL